MIPLSPGFSSLGGGGIVNARQSPYFKHASVNTLQVAGVAGAALGMFGLSEIENSYARYANILFGQSREAAPPGWYGLKLRLGDAFEDPKRYARAVQLAAKVLKLNVLGGLSDLENMLLLAAAVLVVIALLRLDAMVRRGYVNSGAGGQSEEQREEQREISGILQRLTPEMRDVVVKIAFDYAEKTGMPFELLAVIVEEAVLAVYTSSIFPKGRNVTIPRWSTPNLKSLESLVQMITQYGMTPGQAARAGSIQELAAITFKHNNEWSTVEETLRIRFEAERAERMAEVKAIVEENAGQVSETMKKFLEEDPESDDSMDSMRSDEGPLTENDLQAWAASFNRETPFTTTGGFLLGDQGSQSRSFGSTFVGEKKDNDLPESFLPTYKDLLERGARADMGKETLSHLSYLPALEPPYSSGAPRRMERFERRPPKETNMMMIQRASFSDSMAGNTMQA